MMRYWKNEICRHCLLDVVTYEFCFQQMSLPELSVDPMLSKRLSFVCLLETDLTLPRSVTPPGHCSSIRRVSAANVVCRSADIFSESCMSVERP
jgi:hypothetical protein